MFVLKIATIFLLVLAVRAEKKIELIDIEEDNLRSEKAHQHKDSEILAPYAEPDRAHRPPIDLAENSFRAATVNPQQQRYVQQYAVTEPPEKPEIKPKFLPPKQTFVGYLSNFPLQVYVVSQYDTPPPSSLQHLTENPAVAPVYQIINENNNMRNYQPMHEEQQSQTHAYLQPFSPPVQFISYQTIPVPTAPTPQPVVTTYRAPVVHYSPAPPPSVPHDTYNTIPQYDNTQYTVINSVDVPHHEHGPIPQSENLYSNKESEFPRHYNSMTPVREDYRHVKSNIFPHLLRPDPSLFKAPHPAFVPKALPQLRRPIVGRVNTPGAIPVKPPTSLLESYIPSAIQYQFLKKGIFKEPAEVYDALSSGRVPYPIPRHYERGFLPNQMYHTAAGGTTYGYYKRGAKSDKPHKKTYD